MSIKTTTTEVIRHTVCLLGKKLFGETAIHTGAALMTTKWLLMDEPFSPLFENQANILVTCGTLWIQSSLRGVFQFWSSKISPLKKKKIRVTGMEKSLPTCCASTNTPYYCAGMKVLMSPILVYINLSPQNTNWGVILPLWRLSTM